MHGTTHERPADRFAREAFTPLGQRPPYRYEQARQRRVPADALVAIAAGRYSVPVQYVGIVVTTHYEICARVLRSGRRATDGLLMQTIRWELGHRNSHRRDAHP